MPLDFSPETHMPWWLSAPLVLSVSLAFGFAIMRSVRELVAQRRAKVEADALYDEGAMLLLGARHVAGIVELDEGVPFAARVEIHQLGSETKGSKGGWSHSWREQSRTPFCRPFWIRHASGERVLVEAAPKVHLVDRLDRTVHDRVRGERYRIAELSAGEQVVAEGRLERMHDPSHKSGYRDAGKLWVLRPIRGIERLHLSAEALSARHRRRSRKILLGLVFGCLPMLAFAGVLLGPYAARALFGELEIVTVERKQHYTTRGNKGGTNHHYDVHFVNASGERDHDSLDSDDWYRVNGKPQMLVLTVPGWRAATCLGSHATVNAVAWLFAMVLGLGAIGVTFMVMGHEWYREGTTWNEGGSGRLPEVSPSSIRVYSRDGAA